MRTDTTSIRSFYFAFELTEEEELLVLNGCLVDYEFADEYLNPFERRKYIYEMTNPRNFVNVNNRIVSRKRVEI